MIDGGDLIGLAAVTFIFGGGTISYIVKSMVKVAELKAQVRQTKSDALNREVMQTLDSLKQEVAALRETSTKFDISFDAALTRLEGRVDRIEDRYITPTAPTREYSSQASEQQVVLSRGGREDR